MGRGGKKFDDEADGKKWEYARTSFGVGEKSTILAMGGSGEFGHIPNEEKGKGRTGKLQQRFNGIEPWESEELKTSYVFLRIKKYGVPGYLVGGGGQFAAVRVATIRGRLEAQSPLGVWY